MDKDKEIIENTEISNYADEFLQVNLDQKPYSRELFLEVIEGIFGGNIEYSSDIITELQDSLSRILSNVDNFKSMPIEYVEKTLHILDQSFNIVSSNWRNGLFPSMISIYLMLFLDFVLVENIKNLHFDSNNSVGRDLVLPNPSKLVNQVMSREEPWDLLHKVYRDLSISQKDKRDLDSKIKVIKYVSVESKIVLIGIVKELYLRQESKNYISSSYLREVTFELLKIWKRNNMLKLYKDVEATKVTDKHLKKLNDTVWSYVEEFYCQQDKEFQEKIIKEKWRCGEYRTGVDPIL